MRISVGVLTKAQPTPRRQACAATWVRRLKAHADITPVFVIGGTALRHHVVHDLLETPGPDDRMVLALKTYHWARWTLEQGFDYGFKCDDDTFVHAERLARFDPAGRDYIGVDPVNDDEPAFASGGAGYWLSRRALAELVTFGDAHSAEYQAPKPGQPRKSEDFDFVARAMSAAGIAFHHDRRFQAWCDAWRFPTRENDGITVHYVVPEVLYALDAYFHGDGAIAPQQLAAQRLQRAKQVPGHMYDEELAWLAARATGQDVVVEIGSWRGRSTVALAQARRVYAVDWWRGSPELAHENVAAGAVFNDFQKHLAFEIATGAVCPLPGDLRDDQFRAVVRHTIGRSARLVFIDANHSYHAVREDIALARALLLPGGILCGHDYGQYEGVTRAVNELVGKVNRPVGSIWSTV